MIPYNYAEEEVYRFILSQFSKGKQVSFMPYDVLRNRNSFVEVPDIYLPIDAFKIAQITFLNGLNAFFWGTGVSKSEGLPDWNDLYYDNVDKSCNDIHDILYMDRSFGKISSKTIIELCNTI